MPSKGPVFRPGDLLPGTKYSVVKQLGAGGMGVVYQVAKPPEIPGVLKLMSHELTAHEEFRTRFFDEVRILAQLDHPNIVKVFDYDSLTDGTPYYVMELLQGRTLRDVISTMGAVPPRAAFEITRQLLEALHCAHTHDVPVVHRDIKPENIFLHSPKHGEPILKLIDFGVMAVADRADDGGFIGTWSYAAPEQIRGEQAVPATDLYSVGLVLYEMLAGFGPFDHLDGGQVLAKAHLGETPSPVTRFAPWVPQSIVALIASALAKDPQARPRDAYAFAERLFELEWAKDNDSGRAREEATVEGPLSQVLSTTARKLASGVPEPKRQPRAKPAAEPAPVAHAEPRIPLLAAVPESARHQGATLPGVGGINEPTAPGEDALLDGLASRLDLHPRAKSDPAEPTPRAGQVVIRPSGPDMVVVESGPDLEAAAARMDSHPASKRARAARSADGAATLDAPLSAPPTTMHAKSAPSPAALGLGVLGVLGLIVVGAFAMRTTTASPAHAGAAPPAATSVASAPPRAVPEPAPSATPVMSATPAMSASASPPSPSSAPSSQKKRGRPGPTFAPPEKDIGEETHGGRK